MITIKLFYQGCCRKFLLSDDNLFSKVMSLVSEITRDKIIPRLVYLDEDQDWVTISTESDLLLCLQTQESLKIHIVHSNDEVVIAKENEGEDELKESKSRVDLLTIKRASAIDIDRIDAGADYTEIKVGIAEANESVPSDKSGITEASFTGKRSSSTEPTIASAPINWIRLADDFLTCTKQPLRLFIGDVYDGVKDGKDLKSLVMIGIEHSSFNYHPFIRLSLNDLEDMLDKVNHMSTLLLHAGKEVVEMAVPLLVRGYAEMKVGDGDGVIDLAPVFKRFFPRKADWLEEGLDDGQEATFDLGKVMRLMIDKEKDDDLFLEKESKEEANAAAAGIVIHKGIVCDICNTKPIIGVRYKCMTCLDFDMCEFCRRGNHPVEHPLIALQVPVPRRGFRLGRGNLKGASEFFKPNWMQNKRCKKR